jgi:hypothetical protein
MQINRVWSHFHKRSSPLDLVRLPFEENELSNPLNLIRKTINRVFLKNTTFTRVYQLVKPADGR